MRDQIRSFDHTSIAVEHIEDALPLFRDLMGGDLVGGADEGDFRWIQLRYPGGSKIELIDPKPGDNFLRRFLDRHGPGMHHITFKVHDLKAAIAAAEAAGFKVVDEHEIEGWKEAFIHPKSGHGVLIQLAESPFDEGAEGSPIQGDSAERLLGLS
jgi:methylmalonyl-CoA/ethylmalonyl-CoA epimerase